jgi:hypothetical protein
MRTLTGRWATGLVVALTSVALLAGCRSATMADKQMMEKEAMTDEEKVMKKEKMMRQDGQ